jgi:tRNA-splicing ligase RtcB
VNKVTALTDAGRRFLEQIADLLNDLGVRTFPVTSREEYTNDEGETTVRVRLNLGGTPDSLLALYEKIGFEYHREKRMLAHCAVQYSRLKETLLQHREEVAAQAVKLKAAGVATSAIYESLVSEGANRRFLQRSLFEGRKTRPRIPQVFQTFEDFVEERTVGLGMSGMVWDRIVRSEEIPFDEPVYDITVSHEDHNFVANGFVVSNCGMRLVVTNLTYDEVKPHLRQLVDNLFKRVPAGVGSKGFLRISPDEFREAVEQGARWCVKRGYGWEEDLERTEESGCIAGADATKISNKAVQRGHDQIGTLGSGNHYLEIQVARPEYIFDEELAKAFGITIPNQVVVMFHCGSRGFGHQVATDHLQTFLNVMESKYGIKILDRELACAPFQSPEGQAYYTAMKCGINMSYANRQVIAHRIREVFSDVFHKDAAELGMHQVYDVAHNTAKLEKHVVDGELRELLVHRKGATRAFGPGMDGLPAIYKPTGQPIIIGGSMETGSYLLAGVPTGDQTFYTTAHGSGRTMSRTKAKKMFNGKELQRQMEERGIYVRTVSYAGLAEEAGPAYKDIDDVIEATQHAGISKRVVRLVPVGNVKG